MANRKSLRQPSATALERTMQRALTLRSAGRLAPAARALAPWLRRSPARLTPKANAFAASLARQILGEAKQALRRGEYARARTLLQSLRHFPRAYGQKANRLLADIATLRAKESGARKKEAAPGKKRSAKKHGVKKAKAARRSLKAAKRTRKAGRAVAEAPPARKRGGGVAYEETWAGAEYAAAEEAGGAGDGAAAGAEEVQEMPLTAGLEDDTRSIERGGPEALRGGRRRGLTASTAGAVRSSRRPSAAAAGDGGAGEATARDTIVRRTPHMDLSVEEPIPPGTTLDVLVYADQQEARPGELSEGIIIVAPETMREFKVDVDLLVSEHFSLIAQAVASAAAGGARSLRKKAGSKKGQMIIRRDEPATQPVQFALRVAEAVKLPKTQPTITALFHYQGRPSGKVVRTPSIQGLNVREPAERRPVFLTQRGAKPPKKTAAPPALAVQTDAVAADLTIRVLESPEKDGRHFTLMVDAKPVKQHWEGPWVLRASTDQIVQGAMQTFIDPNADATGRIAELQGAGIQFFTATPREFQNLFWDMVDKKKLPGSILVVSEEPYIPWELMVPQRRLPNGELETREALGVEFAIGRWVTDKFISPPQKIALNRTYVVAPQYPPGRNLPNAAAEAQFVSECFTPSQIIQPALLANINSTLQQAGATLLHFVCHGESGFPQAISLEGDVDKLNCWMMKSPQLQGFSKFFPKYRTFVFLNACEVGRQTPALVGVGGFGNSFVEIGASAVVAPLWSVDDDVAHQVARQFYDKLKKSPAKPFAEILRDIRKQAYTGTAEDTWAAYCFYGDPLARRVEDGGSA